MPRKHQFEEPFFDVPLSGGGAVPYEPQDNAPPSDMQVILRKHEAHLMAISGVKGIGEGLGPVGNPAIEVYITHPGVARSIPRKLEGVDVVTKVVGEIDAYLR
jgi:hypothetical protein